MKRKNRLWLPQNTGVQATMCICEECGEAYEADREHICRKVNSYPLQRRSGRKDEERRDPVPS